MSRAEEPAVTRLIHIDSNHILGAATSDDDRCIPAVRLAEVALLMAQSPLQTKVRL